MSAHEKLAEAIHRGSGCACGIAATPTSHTQAVIDAIRAMSPAEQAELIGGRVCLDTYFAGDDPPTRGFVLGPWRPVEDA